MVEFRKFMAIWFAAIVTGTVFMAGYATLLNLQSTPTEANENHFSVVWKGFKPTYNDAFPDYYICINNLKDDALRMHIQLKIENYENVSLYFMIDKYIDPSAGWFVGPQHFGFIDIEDPIKYFTYSNINRTKPTVIPEGSLHESVELVVKAYLDASYTQFYSQDNFTANFHFIDVTAAVWSKNINNTFDDGTPQGWFADVHSWKYYRSWPCSLIHAYAGFGQMRLYKSFDLTGSYTEAYFVASVLAAPQNLAIYLNGSLHFQPEVSSGTQTWYQIALPLPLNNVTVVEFAGYNVNYPYVLYLDDVYVLAK